MQKIIKLGGLILLCAPISLAQAQPEPLTTTEQAQKIHLEPLQLIQQALHVHPVIRAAQNDIEAARLEQQVIQRQRYFTPSAQAQFREDYRSAKVAIENLFGQQDVYLRRKTKLLLIIKLPLKVIRRSVTILLAKY